MLSGSSSLTWLREKINAKGSRVNELLARMSGFGTPGGLKPKLFSKFLGLMHEVAHESTEQDNYLNRIEAMEHRHRFRRRHKKLEAAEEGELQHPIHANDDECSYNRADRQREKERKRFWWQMAHILGLWGKKPSLVTPPHIDNSLH